MPVKTLDLNGKWKLKDCEHKKGNPKTLAQPKSEQGWVETAVPGDIHQTLQETGRIPDPYFGRNPEECRWTNDRDWWHVREVKVPKNFRGERTDLVLDGIDTYAVVYVNGQEAGRTDNMFLQYRLDVTELVKPGETNTIAINVQATRPIIESRDTSKYLACFYTPRIFARKAQCQFSWDWAPNLPALGIWRDVRLEAVSEGVIEDVHMQTKASGDVFCKVYLDQYGKQVNAKDEPESLALAVYDGDLCVAEKETHLRGGENFLNFRIEKPKLWWPKGYGKPHLYTYTLELRQGKKVVDTYTGRFGIREVELVQEPRENNCHGFTFRVNGIEVFSQGGNWVPADSFPGIMTRERYAHLLRLAAEAHFNTLRVWGGGIYEQDDFYDLCDEMGLMVWQDLMFACADIPDDDKDFALSVIPEFEYQVKRLRKHPCIVHWCGGNEKTGTFGAMINYGDTITRYLARGVVNDHCPELAYTPSSPFSHTEVGNHPDSGDTHGGIYEHAFKDDPMKYRDYIGKKNSVFNSEFGYHGPCRMRSLRKFMPSDALWPLNDYWEYHVQDNPYNDLPETFVQVQEKYAAAHFHQPQSAADFVKTAGTFYAELLSEEFLHHRRQWPFNAGALVWMFNDTWPCASWSIVDYYGVPKAAYYSLKRACQPLVASFKPVTGGHELWLTSSRGDKVRGSLTVEERNVDGTVNLLGRKQATLNSRDSQAVFHVANKTLSRRKGGFLTATFKVGKEEVRTLFFHNHWKNIDWPDPGLSLKVSGCRKNKAGEFTAAATLTAENFARCVNLITAEDMDAYFSDNYFDMLPGETKKVTVTALEPFDPKALILHHWLTEWED